MIRFGAFTVILLASLTALAQKPVQQDKAEVLFTIHKKATPTDEFEYLYRKNNQGKKDEFTEEKIRQYLDLYINFKLKVYEATQRGMDTTQAFRKEFRSYRDELKKPYVASADELSRLVKEAYDRMRQEVRASHILINVSPDASPSDTLIAYTKATGILKRIEAGESFDVLARELSEDPSAKQNAGDLGFFTSLQMVYPFEDAAYKLEPGEISQPVRTRFGYHLIKVTGKRDAQGEVEVAHILLRGTDEKLRNKAFEIYDQLKGGRPWDELCSEFSEDTGTKNNGGKLRPFGVGALASVPEFEAVAFSLQQPGEISDPFKSGIGWHIVRLERKIPVPSFAELEATLKRRVGRDERLQISKTMQLNKRKKELNYSETSSSKDFLFQMADSTLQKGMWTLPLQKKNADAVLFSLLEQEVRVGEFYQFVVDHQRPSALSPASYLQQLLDQFVEEKINESEDEKLLRENADYRNLTNEYREGILLFSIMEKEVWNKASEDSVGQRHYYEKNTSKYQAGERVNARLLATADASFLTEVKGKILHGDTLKESDMRRFKIALQARAYEKGENKAIDKVTWAVGLHETEVDGLYYLVEIDRLIPAGIKSFSEARASIISDYQDELDRQWVQQLRSRYPVKVNKKIVKAAIGRLTKNG